MYKKLDFFKRCCWTSSSGFSSGAVLMMHGWGGTGLTGDELWYDHALIVKGAGREYVRVLKHVTASWKNERILSDSLYPNTLVNFAENCGGVTHFDFLFFRSTRTSTPVTCPWATWYFRWSTNRSRNRKICACCWGNSPVVEVFVTVLCLSSCLELPLHRWGCEPPVSLLERTAKEPPFLAFPSEFLSAVSFRQLKWYLQARFYNSCVQILCCLLTKEVFLFIQCT